MKRVGLCLIYVCAGLASACAPRAHTPPSFFGSLGPPMKVAKGGTIGEGRFTLGQEIPGISSFSSEWGAFGGQLQLEHGLIDQLAIVGSSYLARIYITETDAAPQIADDPSRLFGGLRGGLRYAPYEHLNTFVGFGGGTNPWGGHVGPDLGISLGYVNDSVTPFLSTHLSFGIPVETEGIEVRNEPPISPVATMIVQSAFGLQFASRSRWAPWVSIDFSALRNLEGLPEAQDEVQDFSAMWGFTVGVRFQGFGGRNREVEPDEVASFNRPKSRKHRVPARWARRASASR
mgnify:FL=1